MKCTYIVLLHNNEDNIPNLVKSLEQLDGDFKKEFIIIDDGSKDKSLNVAKISVNDLPKTTIITQENQGPTVSINKALSLATGDYIHFVLGDEIPHPLMTSILIDACVKFGTEVACCATKKSEDNFDIDKKLDLNFKLIVNPLNEILSNKNPAISNIGGSGTLVNRSLIEKIGKADPNIYSQTMSLSLRCAKYSKFVFVNNVLSHKKYNNLLIDESFESYNNLRSIYNFVINHKEICQTLKPELIKRVYLETLSNKSKINYYLQYLYSKYTKSIKLDKIIQFYKNEYEKLF